MVQRVQIVLFDDLDGSPADETVTFGLDGVTYEIDLTTEHAAELRAAIEPWSAKGRRVTNTRKSVRRSQDNAKAIREWARANGYEVSERGRIAATIREAYEAANA
jgi:hypothetical protein